MSESRNITTLIKHSAFGKNGIDYHFANPKDAAVFIRHLQTTFWSKNIASLLRDESHRCKFSDNYQRCSAVSLTSHQFNAIHGANSFDQLLSMYRRIDNDTKSEDALVYTKVPPTFIDELSYLVPTLHDKACNAIAMTTVNNVDLINYTVFRDQIIPRMSISTIEKMYQKNKSYDFLFQMLHQSKLSHAELIIFLRKLNKQTCRELVLSLKSQIFDLAIKLQTTLFLYFSNDEFNQFISQLLSNQDISNKTIVAMLEHHARLSPPNIAKLNYQRKRHRHFVENPKKISKFINAMFDFSQEVKPIAENHSLLPMIEIVDGGQSYDDWILFTEEVFQYAPEVSSEKMSLNMPFHFDEEKIIESSQHIKDFVSKDWQHHQFVIHQDETITLELKNSKGDFLIFRIQKKDEPLELLIREYKTTSYYKREANNLGLQSYFPQPIGIIKLAGLTEYITKNITSYTTQKELLDFLGSHSKHGVYLCKIPKKNSAYLKCLDDPSLSHDDYQKANKIIIHDLMIMLQHGVLFPTLANLVHHSHSIKEERYDLGRFWVLAGLLLGNGNGTGRLERIDFIAKEQNNLRASGIIHWHQFITFNDLIGLSSYNRQYFKGVYARRDEVVNYVIGNLLAEYQYLLFIVAGLRGLALENIKNVDKNVLWENLANQVLTNSAYGASLITHQPQYILKNMFSDIVNVKRIGRQMQYWFTKEYIDDVMQDRVKDDIYAKDTKVMVNHESFRTGTFNSYNGFSFDFIHSDLGNFHGQEPIKEANKLFYFMVTFIMVNYIKFQLTLDDLRTIISCKDLLQSEKIRKHSFMHLYGKDYHSIQEKLCEERLSQKDQLPSQIKNSIIAEVKNHKKEKASFMIAQFWRRHKKPSSSVPEIKKVNQLNL